MSVSNTNNKVIYAMDGATLVYAVPFKFFKNSDLVVKKVLTATGAETTLTITTNYTLTGAGNANGGELTLTATIDNTYKLVIQRILPLKQEADYVENDPFPAETHEEVADRAVMVDQQQQETLDRCIKIGAANEGVDIELPDPVADAILGWNSAGTGLENKEEQGTLLAQCEAARDAAQAAQASVNLPTITGNALKLLQVNAGATGYQFITTIADSLLAAISTAGKVLGSALTSLSSTPSGAGQLPAVNGGVPTGVFFPFGGTAAPSGYLLCDGSAVSRTTYAALFAVLGTAFGVGDGSTTFTLPTNDRLFINKGSTFSTLGATGGSATKDTTHGHTGSTGTPSGPNTNVDGSSSPVANGSHTHTVTINDGGNAAQDVMNPYQITNYIIKT